MKYLKVFNEEIKFKHEWDSECIELQNKINYYNDLLIDDEDWINFYRKTSNLDNSLDSDYLESVIEFGKKRIDDIKKEKEELLMIVKDIFQSFEDDVDFIKEIEYKNINLNSLGFNLYLNINLNDNAEEDIKYFLLLPYYTPFAIEILKNLAIISERLKSYGLSCFINYSVKKKINVTINQK